MVNVKCSKLIGIEAWTSSLIVRRASLQTCRIPCLDLYHLTRVVIQYIYSKLFYFIISQSIDFTRLGYLLWSSNSQSIKVMLLLSQLSLVDFATLCFIIDSVPLSICQLFITTSLIVVVIVHIEVECSAIHLNRQIGRAIQVDTSYGT